LPKRFGFFPCDCLDLLINNANLALIQTIIALPYFTVTTIKCKKVVKVASKVVTDKKRISLYVEENLKIDLERLAKIRKRSLSNLIEVICEEVVIQALHSGELDDSDYAPRTAQRGDREPKKEET
jgi:CopG-like RHH_1 or ribbon-helix-helix domain, RHH_5